MTVIHQVNRGGSAARNRGFWASGGDFIQFLDHDDLLHPDKIATQIACSVRGAMSPIMGKWIRFRGDMTKTLGAWEPGAEFNSDASSLDWLIAPPVVPTCAWLFPRDLVLRAGLWNESLHENPADDFEFQIRVASQTERILSCPEALSYFRTENPRHAGSNLSINALTSVYQTCNTYKSVVLSKSSSAKARKSCADRYYHFMYMAYPKCPELVAAAGRAVRSLGSSSKHVLGTPTYNTLAHVLGWKLARRLQRLYTSLRRH